MVVRIESAGRDGTYMRRGRIESYPYDIVPQNISVIP